jgi:hypothetical protein
MSNPQPNALVRASRAALEAPCSSAIALPSFETITSAAVAQYTSGLALPLQVIGAFTRMSSCDWQWLALSTSEKFPTQFGKVTSLS